MRLEDIRPDMRVAGVVPGGLVTVGAAQSYGPDAVRLTYTDPQGSLAQRVLFRSDEAALAHVHAAGAPFDADPEKFKLAAEAQRIQLAGLYDPMLAVATSNIEPLPHQIRAVYGELLPRTPLRFLLADDPGAGKTITAGLYIKELLLRDDVKRCLVVAPGGLVEQWQDELFLKFGLSFDILTRESVTAAMHTSVFEKYPLLSPGWTSSPATRTCAPSSSRASGISSSSAVVEQTLDERAVRAGAVPQVDLEDPEQPASVGAGAPQGSVVARGEIVRFRVVRNPRVRE